MKRSYRDLLIEWSLHEYKNNKNYNKLIKYAGRDFAYKLYNDLGYGLLQEAKKNKWEVIGEPYISTVKIEHLQSYVKGLKAIGIEVHVSIKTKEVGVRHNVYRYIRYYKDGDI